MSSASVVSEQIAAAVSVQEAIWTPRPTVIGLRSKNVGPTLEKVSTRMIIYCDVN
jgi:hypothetical protein